MMTLRAQRLRRIAQTLLDETTKPHRRVDARLKLRRHVQRYGIDQTAADLTALKLVLKKEDLRP